MISSCLRRCKSLLEIGDGCTLAKMELVLEVTEEQARVLGGIAKVDVASA